MEQLVSSETHRRRHGKASSSSNKVKHCETADALRRAPLPLDFRWMELHYDR